MRKFILVLIGLLLAGAVAAQTLTLTNLKGPIAKASGKPAAKSIAELWKQINALPAAVPVVAPTPAPTPVPTPAPSPTPTPAAPPLAVWTDCAGENEMCDLTGQARVRYGLGQNVWFEKPVSSAQIRCSYQVFGDPMAWAPKRCQTTPTPAITYPTPGMPMTSPPGVTVPSPSLAGVAPIASGIDVVANLSKAWGTGDIPPPDDGDEGAFRFLCTPSHNAFDDPIVYPGQPGKSHLHTFFGNTKADANSTYAGLRTTGGSTCNNALNRSAYWIAAMIGLNNKVVMPDYISIYYKRAKAGSKYCAPPYAQACLALPRGLRYIFGYNMTNPAKSDQPVMRWFNCDGPGAVIGHFSTIREAAAGCPAGARLGMLIAGPSCWNGRDLDSPDHRSHMAYPAQNGNGQSVCPSTHPYLLPFFESASWYPNDGTAALWRLSSDVAMGTEGGVTAHADWWGAWEDSVKDRWTANCIDKGLNCSGGDLGDGFMLTNTPAAGLRGLVDPPAMAMAH